MRPLLPDFEYTKKILKQSISTGQISNFGPAHAEFEALSELLSKRKMLPVTNGTAAIQVACLTTFDKGARVAVPDFTHIASLIAIVHAGFTPVIIGSNKKTWTIDFDLLREHKSEYDAILVVSPFGYYVDVNAYDRFALHNDKRIVYDFAGAWGSFPDTQWPVCYSTHPTKLFTTGEGGIISFHRLEGASFLEAKRLVNFSICSSGVPVDLRGSNWKMDDIRCAILYDHMSNSAMVQLKLLNRKTTLEVYTESLYKHSPARHHFASPSMCVFPNMNPDIVYDKFITKQYFRPLSTLSATNGITCFVDDRVTEYFKRCIALPIDVSAEEQMMIIKEVKRAHKKLD